MNGRRRRRRGRESLSWRLLLEVGGEWDESGVKERKATFMWFLARTMMFRPDGVKWSLVTWRMGMNGRRRRESLLAAAAGGGRRVGEASSSGLSPQQGIPLSLSLRHLSISTLCHLSLKNIKGRQCIVTLPCCQHRHLIYKREL